MSKRLYRLVACACLAIAGCGPAPVSDGLTPDAATLHIFHNNRGAMCLDALVWLDVMRAQYPDLAVTEHLTDDSSEVALLNQWESNFDASQGVSASFGWLPIIFYGGQAFSGFDDQIAQDLATLIASAHAP